MGNLFYTSEAAIIGLLGIPSAIYLFIASRSDRQPIEHLSETIGNYSLFNSLYSIFLSMALVTLMVNFNTVQDDTRKEGECIVSAARLMNGLTEAADLKRSLVEYARSVVTYDLPAMEHGDMSEQASAAFDALWAQAYQVRLETKNDEAVQRLVLGDLSEITKSRMSRRLKAKENLHPMIFALIVVGYYVMLVKTYLTRVGHRKTQLAFELSMFVMIILVITVIVDLNTPFVGLVNVDTSSFNWALQRAAAITSVPAS